MKHREAPDDLDRGHLSAVAPDEHGSSWRGGGTDGNFGDRKIKFKHGR